MKPTAELLDEYLALKKAQEAGSLSETDAQRLELLADVLLELGALSMGTQKPLRPIRAPTILQVDFSDAQRAVRSYSKNIGTGGIAVKCEPPPAKGSTLELRLMLPDGKPLVTKGTVVWTDQDTAGIAFGALPPDDERRLREVVLADSSVLSRIRNVLTTDVKTAFTQDVRELGTRPLEPVQSVPVDTRPAIIVALGDAELVRQLGPALEEHGYQTRAPGPSPTLRAILVDAASALDTLVMTPRPPGTPIVMVNVSGPHALVGKLAALKAAGFVKAPATVDSVLGVLLKLI